MTIIIGATLYNLYITLLLIENGFIAEHCVIVFNVKPEEFYIWQSVNLEVLKRNYYFQLRKQSRVLQITRLNLLIDKFFYAKLNCKQLINFMWVCDRISNSAKVAYDLADEVVLVEEGATAWHIACDRGIKRVIKQLIGYRYDFIDDEKIKQVYVTSKTNYSASFAPKMKNLDVVKLESSLTPESVKTILSIFREIDNIAHNDGKSLCFVFTQPLFIDKFISASTQFEYYSKICSVLSESFNVIIKPHPRDTMDYSQIPRTTVFPSEYPSELMNIMDFDIHLAVGICTSAVETINAKHKININNDFLKDGKLPFEEIESIVKKQK